MRRGADVDLVLIGLGAVTRAFVDLLRRRRSSDLRWRIVGVATARHGCAHAPDGIDVSTLLRLRNDGQSVAACQTAAAGSPPSDALELLARVAAARPESSDAPETTVVENTPLGLERGQPGVDHARAALANGAHVITANKGPAAFAYRELQRLADDAEVAFRFEGAVLDGLPIFSLLRDTLPDAQVRRVRGVVNTTTNHVFTAMETGRTLDAAVADMQAAGVTEADPSLDIDGWDAAAKAAVLANALFDANMTPHAVDRRSLRTVDTAEVEAAREAGGAVKFVASVEPQADGVVATAAPCRLAADDPLARLTGTAKGLILDTDVLGPIMISKAASGVTHTAYALLADLLSIHTRQTQIT